MHASMFRRKGAVSKALGNRGWKWQKLGCPLALLHALIGCGCGCRCQGIGVEPAEECRSSLKSVGVGVVQPQPISSRELGTSVGVLVGKAVGAYVGRFSGQYLIDFDLIGALVIRVNPHGFFMPLKQNDVSMNAAYGTKSASSAECGGAFIIYCQASLQMSVCICFAATNGQHATIHLTGEQYIPLSPLKKVWRRWWR